jgi:hypothetical protein
MKNYNKLFVKNLKEEAQNNDATTKVINLWTQLTVLLSEVCKTAAITKLNELYSIKEAEKYFIPWPDIIKDIEAYRNRLKYCIDNNLINLVYEKSERLFSLSDGRQQMILCLKGLVNDLKLTEPKTLRYKALNVSITLLFNSINLLLAEIERILEDSNYEIKTNTYDLTNITKEDIGL